MTRSNSSGNSSDRGRLLLVLGGFATLSLGLTLLIFGSGWFSNDTADSAALQSIPAFSGTPESAVAPLDPEFADLPVAGSVAPDFALVDLNGNTVRLSDLQGQPVLINFWATWCPPCRVEMPELEQAQIDYADSGVAIFLVNQKESPTRVKAFVDDMGLTTSVLLDSEGQVGSAYGAIYLPSTIFIGPDGVVTAVHRGLINREQIDEYLNSMNTETGG